MYHPYNCSLMRIFYLQDQNNLSEIVAPANGPKFVSKDHGKENKKLNESKQHIYIKNLEKNLENHKYYHLVNKIFIVIVVTSIFLCSILINI